MENPGHFSVEINISSPAPATAEKGKLVHDTVVRLLGELIAREFGKK